MIRLLSSIILLLTTLSAVALEFNLNGYHYEVIDDTNDLICTAEKDIYDSVKNLRGDIVIPGYVTYDGVEYTVVALGELGFRLSKITSVVIPNTVKRIEHHCFAQCERLKEITFGENVEYISGTAVQSDRALERITFLSPYPPYWGADLLDDIGHAITIQVDKENILCYACVWSAYSSLKYSCGPFIRDHKFVTFTSSRPLEIYSDEDFEYAVCEETKECAILKNLHPEKKFDDFYIPSYATLQFGSATDTYKIVGIASGTGKSFGGIKPLIKASGTLSMSDNIRFIGDYAFTGETNDSHSNFTAVKLSENLKFIGRSAFKLCGISNIEFGTKLRVIRPWAFYGMQCLTLKLPANLKRVEEKVFAGGVFETIELNDGLESIEASAFQSCPGVNEIIIPSSVMSIGKEAFNSCGNLKQVKFGEGLKNIGASAFSSSSIENIIIPQSVRTIENYAFKNCPIKTVAIQDGTNHISLGENAIGDETVETLYLGRNFSLTTTTFKNLQTLEVGNLVNEIPANAFKNSGKLVSVRFGSGLTTIGDEAFKYCMLHDIELPSRVTDVEAESFYGNRLNSITFGAGIEKIADNTFGGNASIGWINITAKVPPAAKSNVFTNYDAFLFTDPEYSEAYASPDRCWSFFKQNQLTTPDGITLDTTEVELESGDELCLTATISPTSVSLHTVLWESSNPEVAIVDLNGKVTMQPSRDGQTFRPCTIRAYTLYADGPVAECQINGGESSVNAPIIDRPEEFNPRMPYRVYNISGRYVSDDLDKLPKGIYIVVQGSNSFKRAI